MELTLEERLRRDVARQGIDGADVLLDEAAETPAASVQPTLRMWGPIVQAALDMPDALPLTTPKPLPVPDVQDSKGLTALFAAWEDEDVALTPEAYAERERQWETFRDGINAARREAGEEVVY